MQYISSIEIEYNKKKKNDASFTILVKMNLYGNRDVIPSCYSSNFFGNWVKKIKKFPPPR